MKYKPVAPATGIDLIAAEALVRKAITTGRGDKYKGLHSVYGGLNGLLRKVYPNHNPVAITNALAEAGKIVVRFAKGGAVVYLPEDAPAPKDSAGDKLAEKMGLTVKRGKDGAVSFSL